MNSYEELLKGAEFEDTQPRRSWYVARRVATNGHDLTVTTLPETLETSDGSSLSLAVTAPASASPAELSSHRGVLTIPGLIAASVVVDVDVAEFSADLAEVGIRPAKRAPRWPISEKRYFEAAWSVIDALAVKLGEDESARRAA